MDKEKEIIKIKSVLTDIHDKIRYYACGDVMLDWSKALVNAGIGDKKQAVKEFAEKLKDKISLLRFCDVATTEQEYYHDALNDVTYDIDELLKENNYD